ncbi:hypothetical protein, partial [Oceanispirochaeta sp.]|uniref:hypothetical protein n=1 Tax=Oceanispirochaeta sp. TaxID=2035350 RepID=UPI00262C2CBC
MKRIFALMIICILSAGMVFAYNPEVDLDFDSLSSQATFGLFLNELDAAASVNETSKGPGFSTLENSYLFGGIVANVEGMNNWGTSSTFITGYYSASASPWSLFAYVDFSDADTGDLLDENGNPIGTPETQQTEVYNVDGEVITTEYTVPNYDRINTQLQFLKNFGSINTGLKLKLGFDDNRLPASNYTETSNVTGNVYDNTYEAKNGS